ncbi:exopolygalacturonase-like [Dorcoceras hygrometricum]|uniref:Exopolygalacturonase-like n=1 Tax=Dorcoceras hygrometricum TaxID=472368 RepID=A0A2Z7BD58_9LAMI|nr:exopolygalacturonase-like [Dorcoceras hygrometricum]
MDSTKANLFLCALLVTFSWLNSVDCRRKIFNAVKYGAVADGKTDITKALLKSWEKACATKGGVVAVPKGNYSLGDITFEGPCNGATHFLLEGTLIASNSGSSNGKDYWVAFHNINGFMLYGNGTFHGQGESSWGQPGYPRKTSVKLRIENGVIDNIHSVDSKMFHFHVHDSNNLMLKNIHITAPEDSPNTDGIHIGNSKNVKIYGATIATGDDCVSIGSGNTNISVSGVLCGPGHGISIGSLGKYTDEKDVQGIIVRDCTFKDTQNGVRIKTWAPSKSAATLSNVQFINIQVENTKNPILIDQHYCASSSCKTTGESRIKIRDVKFIGVKGNSASEVGVNVQCSSSNPCEDIEFRGLDLTVAGSGEPATASCSNADGDFLGPPQVPSKCSEDCN